MNDIRFLRRSMFVVPTVATDDEMFDWYAPRPEPNRRVWRPDGGLVALLVTATMALIGFILGQN